MDNGMPDVGMPRGRRWQFGPAEFDEAAWVLEVAGARAALENKPLLLLRALLLRPGEAVTKQDLIDTVWPDVVVVPASLPTAMNKLRRALGDRDNRIIETVPGIGYRLAVPVAVLVDAAAEAPALPAASGEPPRAPSAPQRRWWPAVPAVAAVLAAAAVMAMTLRRTMPDALPPVTQSEVLAAMRSLDLDALRGLLDRGWNPNAPLDDQKNAALHRILEICQWDPAHDRQRLMLAVKLLNDGGARLTDRNVWGDTPLSIASAPRYCGAAHPATRAIRATCTYSNGRINPGCLADYAHSDWPQRPPPEPPRSG